MAKRDQRLDDDQTRERILDAARRCLSVKNFHDITMDDISRASLVPRRILYRHFPSKEALLNETVQRGVHQILTLISTLLAEDRASVARLIDLMMPLLSGPATFDIGRFNVEWWAWALRNELALQDFQKTWGQWRARLGAIILSEFKDVPSEQDVEAMATLMLALFNGLLLHATAETGQLDMERITRLQQYAWEGIIERVRAEGLSEEPSPKKGNLRAGR